MILVSQKEEGDDELKGKVGIGTNDPQKKLHVNGDILTEEMLYLNDEAGKVFALGHNVNGYNESNIFSENDLYFQSSNSQLPPAALFDLNSREFSFYNATMDIYGDLNVSNGLNIGKDAFFQNNIDIMGNINFKGSLLHDGQETGLWDKNGNSIEYTAGNVGIGKSPSRNLDIAGTTRAEKFEVENIHLDGDINFNTSSSFPLQITTESGGGGSALEYRTTWATSQGEFNTTTQMKIGGGYEANYILFSDQNERDFVLFNGWDKKVEITGDIDFTGTLSRDGQEVGLWSIQNNGLYTDKRIKVEGTNACIEFPYAGFLKVNNNRDIQALFQNPEGTAGLELYNGNHDRLRLTLNMDNEFVIKNNEDTEHLVINEEGKVGIGIVNFDNHSAMLNVNGRIEAKRVKVSTSNWPDYVFNKEYDMLSMEELEAYIQQNNRLPGVPEAREVEENGVDLGEMQHVLLEKIEELSLYMIELKNENRQLKEKIEVLEEKVTK